MLNPPLAIPLLRATAWFAEDPLDPALAEGADDLLEVVWGKPEVAFVEPLLRRRLSGLARGFFHCAQRIAPEGQLRVVFASRHGEAQRTLTILQDLALEREVSPTLFSLSVHNAVPGLWSILKGNRAAVTAVAAGPESFGWGLVEAYGAYRADPSAPVLYVYGDEPLPEPWAAGVAQPVAHAAAFLIGEPGRASLRLERNQEASPSPAPQLFQALAAMRGPGRAANDGCGWQWHLG